MKPTDTVTIELAEILQSKGFNEPTVWCVNEHGRYYHRIEGRTTGAKIIEVDAHETRLLIPSNEQVLDWIFDTHGMYLYNEYGFKKTLEHLLFWYTTLLEHKFNLMSEFISRLESWFEGNDLYFIYNPSTNIPILKIVGHSFYIVNKKWRGDIHLTKQQAKHEAILKAFDYLKQEIK